LRAEMNVSGEDEDVRLKLQWGRTFLRAEIRGVTITRTRPGLASMGPHVFACGNVADRHTGDHPKGLQWGRTFLRAEISSAASCKRRSKSFNGAARFCVRKLR